MSTPDDASVARRDAAALKPLLALLPVMLLGAAAPYHGGPEYTRDTCPVIGNSKSMIYHTPASEDYRRLLKGGRAGEDHRVCFATEQQARNAGYRKSRR